MESPEKKRTYPSPPPEKDTGISGRIISRESVSTRLPDFPAINYQKKLFKEWEALSRAISPYLASIRR